MHWPNRINPRLVYAIGFAAILIFSSWVLFYKLDHEAFQDYDEATYAEVTSESLAHGNFVSLTFLNVPYFRKPPLLFWFTTTSEQVFTSHEFADRFPSALAGLLTILVVFGIGYEAGAGIGFALVGAAILATTATWMEFARDVRFDTLVSLWIAAAFYAGMRAVRDPRWYLAVGATLALAVLSKSVIVAFAGVGLLSYSLLELGVLGTTAQLRKPYFWGGVAMFFLIAAPWHIVESVRFGSTFWHNYLGTEVIDRATVNLFPGLGNPTNAQYLSYVLQFASPWTAVFPCTLLAFIFLRKKTAGKKRAAILASAITAVSVVVVMTTAQTKAFGYLIPMYPFIAVTIALTASELWQQGNRVLRACLFVVLAVFTLSAAARTHADALHINPYYGWEIGQAYEERDVANLIAATQNSTVYAYNYDALGTILYYSKLPFTLNSHILALSNSSDITGTSFVLTRASLAELQTTFPKFDFTQDYSGKFVSLYTATRSRDTLRSNIILRP